MGYSKDKLKKRKWMKILLVLLLLVFIASLATIIYLHNHNMITKEWVSQEANKVSDDVAKNAKPIVIDNILIGAVYNEEFVSTGRYMALSSYKTNTQMNAYQENGKSGTFTITDIMKKEGYIEANLSGYNFVNEYFAVPYSETGSVPVRPVEVEATEQDYEAVSSALGMYRFLNNSVCITSVHEVTLNVNTIKRIICATSSDNQDSVYSCIVVANVNYTDPKIVKYSYVSDKSNASDWPIYSFEFAGDLNLDGNAELMIREIKEFEVKYDILSYDTKKQNFVEVLSAIMTSVS